MMLSVPASLPIFFGTCLATQEAPEDVAGPALLGNGSLSSMPGPAVPPKPEHRCWVKSFLGPRSCLEQGLGFTLSEGLGFRLV